MYREFGISYEAIANLTDSQLAAICRGSDDDDDIEGGAVGLKASQIRIWKEQFPDITEEELKALWEKHHPGSPWEDAIVVEEPNSGRQAE